MAKNKPTGYPFYEMLYIVPQKFSEEELPKIIEKVKNLLETAGCGIKQTDIWGKKKLAYPIKGYSFGYYILIFFEAPQNSIAQLDRTLRMTGDVLRHIIIKSSPNAMVKTSLKQPTAIEEPKEPARDALRSRPEQQEKKKDPGKVDLKDLDQKLDKLLEVDHLL